MKKLSVIFLFFSGIVLSGCDNKQDKIDYYMKSENLSAFNMGLVKCKTGASDAKDCDAIYEVQSMQEKDNAAKKKENLKKMLSFDH